MNVNSSLRIDAPVEHVWSRLADFGGVAAWSDTLSDSHAVTQTNEGIGARRSITRATDGRVYEEQLTEWTDGERLAYEVVDGLRFPLWKINFTWVVHPEDGGTLVAVSADFRLRLPYGPVGLPVHLFSKRAIRKEMQAALQSLKRHAEH